MADQKGRESRHGVSFSNLDTPVFDGAGVTKRVFVDYLEAMADRIVPVLRDRPLSVIRVQRDGAPFMQKNLPRYTPDWVERITLWEFKPQQATVEKTSDGKWCVTVRLTARKLVADENGVEAERPMEQSAQVGFFKADPRKVGPWRLNKVHVTSFLLHSGMSILTATLDVPPTFVTINPFRTLIQRNADAATLAISQ